MPLSLTPGYGSLDPGAAGTAAWVRPVLPDGAQRAWRVLLLALGVLVPLNLPFSVPPLDADGRPGWFSTSVSDVEGSSARPVVLTRVSRKARTAGVLPGDVLRAIDGVPTTAATLLQRESGLAAGDTVTLLLERRRALREVRVVVEASTVGYRSYTAYAAFVAYLCWIVGMAVIAWRGHTATALLLGAALLLVAPVGFASGVPGDGLLARLVRALWQVEAAAFRVVVPALLLHAIWLQRRRVGTDARWALLYLGLAVLVVGVTAAGRDLLAWTQPGPARTVRLFVGCALEVTCVVTALSLLRRRHGPRDATMRAIVAAIAVRMAPAAVHSGTRLLFGTWYGEEFVSGVSSVAMFALPVAVAVHYFRPMARGPHTRRATWWTSSGVSVGLAGAHALVIAASVAVVLNGSGLDLGGKEWLLFVTVVAASVLPGPAFRWLRAVADRRLVTHWVQVEEDAQAFVAELSSELDPDRIARRVAEEIPALLDVSYATLAEPDAPVADGAVAVPVQGPDRQPLAMLLLGPRHDRDPIDPPTRVLVTTIAQGVGAALTAARAADALRRYEADLAKAERIAALGALTGGLAHEIKNPLAGLKMAVHVLRRGGVAEERLERIDRDVRRIDDLVSGLLRLATTGAEPSGEVVPVQADLSALSRACVADLRHGAEDRGIRLLEHYPDAPVTLPGGPLPYRLIVLNLVANAIESMGGSGAVHVCIDATTDQVAITVTDDGRGIPELVRARIFDLHFTTKRHGTGIGLALVRHEAERLGGFAELAATSLAGTTMRVVLPRPVQLSPFVPPLHVRDVTTAVPAR